MTSSLFRNSVANMGAALLPAVAMLVTLPFIVRMLGLETFGILTMVMAITGYFAIIDINVTAGSTKYVSEYHAKGELAKVNKVITFGLLFYLGLGLLGITAIGLGAPWLVDVLFDLQPDKAATTIGVLRLAGVGFLIAQTQAYLNSVIQAHQRFDLTATAEAIFGTIIPLATVLLLWLGYGLLEVVMLRVATGAIHGVVLAFTAKRLLPHYVFSVPEKATVSKLLSFSGYSFLSRLAALTHAQADKLIIGSLLGMAALAYYAVATQIVGRIFSLTFRLSSVLFPAASAMEARGEMEKLRDIYFKSSKYITYLNGSAILLVCLFGREILHYWMGAEFASVGYSVLLLIAIALFFDSLTSIPSLINDALGRPRNTGLFAIARAILATLLIWLFAMSGEVGTAALGHTVAAVILGSGFLVFIHAKSLPWKLMHLFLKAYLRPLLILMAIAICVIAYKSGTLLTLTQAFSFGIATAVTLALAGWYLIVETGQRLWLRSRLPIAGLNGVNK